MPHKTNRVLVSCQKCAKPFFLAHYFFIRNERRFCSPECFRAVRYGATLEERYWRHVIVLPNGCWGWKNCTSNRYGLLSEKGKRIAAHRFSWELHRGPIPEGLEVLHKCDYRPCSNPEHLFLGTQLDNVLDCARKGRTNTEPGTRAMHKHGEQHTQAKLTEAQVREIRARAATAKRCCARLAREYGVSNGLIIMIVKRKIWTHLE